MQPSILERSAASLSPRPRLSVPLLPVLCGDVLVYDRAVDTNEAASVELGPAAKWGVSLDCCALTMTIVIPREPGPGIRTPAHRSTPRPATAHP